MRADIGRYFGSGLCPVVLMKVHLMVVAMLRAGAVVLTSCSGGTVGSLQPTVQHLQPQHVSDTELFSASPGD